MIFGIARLESYKLCRHPLAIVLTLLTMGLLWLFFYRLLVDYLSLMQHALIQGSRHESLSLNVIKPFFSWSIVVLALILPILTTSAFSTEFSQKTFQLWLTSQITPSQLLLGKWISLLGFTLIILFTMLLMISLLQFETNLDWGMIIGGCIATFTICAALISFGLFISCLFSSPLLAMGATFIGNIFWLLIEWLNPLSQTLFPVQSLSLLNHSYYLLHGYIQSQDLLFYLLFSAFWLALSSQFIKQKMKQVPQ
ncbi:ABC transporter permease subunit [Candidatus Berkiella aquae]|uniref:ABC transporter permease n=1 Tax=Candidatus Berkiella aquae TaxID=295108 RepID=A0A0Q9YU72_9GAMM|nr:ABC transporter permease subunit [Candidatus Berkiella aquae]MCS5710044.1 ABC transporter permease [Candidatus Berkiella aquae]